MRILLTLLVGAALSSCVLYDTWDECETIRKGEYRFKFPEDAITKEITVERTFMGMPSAPDCTRYAHDSDTPDHNAWAECMGVPYR